jgi:hypothetical protein
MKSPQESLSVKAIPDNFTKSSKEFKPSVQLLNFAKDILDDSTADTNAVMKYENQTGKHVNDLLGDLNNIEVFDPLKNGMTYSSKDELISKLENAEDIRTFNFIFKHLSNAFGGASQLPNNVIAMTIIDRFNNEDLMHSSKDKFISEPENAEDLNTSNFVFKQLSHAFGGTSQVPNNVIGMSIIGQFNNGQLMHSSATDCVALIEDLVLLVCNHCQNSETTLTKNDVRSQIINGMKSEINTILLEIEHDYNDYTKNRFQELVNTISTKN